MQISRRSVLAGMASTSLLAGIGGRASAADPITIGVITPLSTPAQFYGNLLRTGIDIAIADYNAAGGVGGRQLTAEYFDDGGDPNRSVTGFRDMSGAGINLFIQGPLSATMLATLPLMKEANAVMMGTAGAMPLTHEAFAPNFFRVMPNNYVAFRGAARAAAEKYPDVRKWASILSEGAAQRALVDYFYKGLVEDYKSLHGADIELVDPVVAKVAAGDYRNQLAIVAASGAQGMINSVLGADNITLYKQAKQMGVDRQIKVFVDGASNELQIAKAMRKSTPNVLSGVAWNGEATKDNALSRKFAEAVIAKTGDKYPPYWAAMGYDSVVALAEAAKSLDGDISDAARIIAALEANKPVGVAGQIAFRKEDHQALRDHFFLSFSGDDSEQGWSINGISVVHGADMVEPPSPGVAFASN